MHRNGTLSGCAGSNEVVYQLGVAGLDFAVDFVYQVHLAGGKEQSEEGNICKLRKVSCRFDVELKDDIIYFRLRTPHNATGQLLDFE